MGVTTTKTNKPFNPRAQDQSPKGFNRAKLFSGKALDFDGVNDNLTATGSNALSFSEITMSAYFKFDNLGATQVIFAKRKDVAGYWSAAFIMSSSGELDFRTTTGTTEQKVVYSDFVTGEYYHAVGVKDDSNNYLYINGQLVDTTASGAIDNTTTYNFVLGNNGTGQYYYNGQIANAKVFDTALTAAQVADLYNNPEKVVPTGVDNTALKLWLPMMEGAGTTAYDGSGNGNHGTISGATYVNGVGAPVAQSAVMDWNKASNILDNSENFSAWNTNAGNTITSDSIAAPDGSTTADTISSPVSSQINQHQVVSPVTSGADYVFSVWLKKKTTSEIQIYLFSASGGSGFIGRASINFDSGNITDIDGTGATIEEYPNGWFRCAVYGTTDSTTLSHGIYTDAAGAADVYAWGAQGNAGATLTPYVRTGATAQTSPVLLPQGLTTGRDITGVNLFENVRKQGALNLDGNSWAEVHDNASLDITSAISVEAWVYWNGEANKGLLGRWETTPASKSFVLYKASSTKIRFYVSNDGSAEVFIQNSTSLSAGWNHIVGVYDGSNIIAYLNGSADGSASYSSGINANTLPLEIGRHSYDSSFAYNDDIAQPRIYNRALTAEEVQRSYDSGKNIYTNS